MIDGVRGMEAVEEDEPFEQGHEQCIVCGCTDDDGCDGGCSWVEAESGMAEYDLCTQCVDHLLDAIFEALSDGGTKSIADVVTDARAAREASE